LIDHDNNVSRIALQQMTRPYACDGWATGDELVHQNQCLNGTYRTHVTRKQNHTLTRCHWPALPTTDFRRLPYAQTFCGIWHSDHHQLLITAQRPRDEPQVRPYPPHRFVLLCPRGPLSSALTTFWPFCHITAGFDNKRAHLLTYYLQKCRPRERSLPARPSAPPSRMSSPASTPFTCTRGYVELESTKPRCYAMGNIEANIY
jgi:hypothetical protein